MCGQTSDHQLEHRMAYEFQQQRWQVGFKSWSPPMLTLSPRIAEPVPSVDREVVGQRKRATRVAV